MLKSNNIFNIDGQQTIGDGNQILICYKNNGRPGKIPVLFIKKTKSQILTKRTPNNEYTLYIAHNVYSMQIKKTKVRVYKWSIML